MAWMIVKQPNGGLARFSDMVDDFTDMNMTVEEEIELCREYMGKDDALKKVQSGIDDINPWKVQERGNGLLRWVDCLKTIEFVHGKARLEMVETEFPVIPEPEGFRRLLKGEVPLPGDRVWDFEANEWVKLTFGNLNELNNAACLFVRNKCPVLHDLSENPFKSYTAAEQIAQRIVELMPPNPPDSFVFGMVDVRDEDSQVAVKALHGRIVAVLDSKELQLLYAFCEQGRKVGIHIELEGVAVDHHDIIKQLKSILWGDFSVPIYRNNSVINVKS